MPADQLLSTDIMTHNALQGKLCFDSLRVGLQGTNLSDRDGLLLLTCKTLNLGATHAGRASL